MKFNTARGLSASYILTVLGNLERKQHHFYAMLLAGEIIAINSADDSRIYSVREFIELGDTFEKTTVLRLCSHT